MRLPIIFKKVREAMTSSTNDNSAQALAALQANDLAAAVHHIGDALWDDTSNPQLIQLAYRILNASDDPLALTSMDQGGSYARASVHALALAQAHKFNEAFKMLLQIAANYDNGFLTWAKQWIDHHPAMTMELIAYYKDAGLDKPLNNYFYKIKDGVDEDSSEYADAMALSYVLGKADESYSDISPISLQYAKSLRLTKQFDKALALAQSYQDLNEKLAYLMEGWAYRDKRDVNNTVLAYQKAMMVDPEDYSILLDAGDTLLNDGQFERASMMYKNVPQNSDESAWAIPSLLACEFLSTQDVRPYKTLIDYANNKNERAQELVDLIIEFKDSYPQPVDLMANQVLSVYNNLKENPGQQTSADKPANMKVNLSGPESPSIVLCMKNAMAVLDEYVNLDIHVKEIPQPDPRQTLNESLGEGHDSLAEKCLLWRFEGTDAVPAVSAPSNEVMQQIAAIADNENHPQKWKAKASQFADKEMEVAATMVNVPLSGNAEENPVYWVYKVQQVAAWILGNIDKGWQGSKRRELLLAIAHNPIDWSINAVLPVLEDIYNQEISSREEIIATFKKLEQRMPKGDGYVCYRHALYSCWSRLPEISLDDRKHAWKKKMAAKYRPYFIDDDSVQSSSASSALGVASGEEIIFPGSPIATVSDYVGMMRLMQTGDMTGAMAKYGMDMMSYGQVAQAWGARLASDPALNAKFMKMITGM
jgi:hypothetical protein